MLSWRLFRALNVFNDNPLRWHPVHLHERRHVLAHRRMRTGRWQPLLMPSLVLIAMVIIVWFAELTGSSVLCLLPFCWFVPLALLLVMMPVWALPIGLVVAPAIASNRARGTWDLLCITPLDDVVLVQGVARAAVEPVRWLLAWLFPALLPLGIIFGMGFVQALMPVLADSPLLGLEEQTELAFVGALVWVGGGILIMLDRLQQLLLMAVGALAGGAAAGSSVRNASVNGASIALVLWLAEVALHALIVFLLPGTVNAKLTDVGLSLFAGPLPGMLVALPVTWAVVAMALILLARELLLRVLWTSTLRAARAVRVR